ncbi:trafficking protein particle complex 8 [Chrysochromulina tobinii]|uniref:Trafficking protein particle complex 8 n=1 Tax=Chrysochromulina tobinii TaxID=1460289 RepID=A0A0M0JYM8_9EUKA|nr:trafficking protein particle complex 8 [Chrysochromulina tobinii]|eukprot:KOO31756.1 trafficking protein particle complex 8 [Chrysochromulina sp. CCMP291]
MGAGASTLLSELVDKQQAKAAAGDRCSRLSTLPEDATLKTAVVWCDEQGVTSVSDMVEFDMVDDFVRHLGLKPIPGKRLCSMLHAPTAALASQIPEAEKVAAAEKAGAEGMECSFWFVNADSLRRAAKPSLPMMQTLRTQEPHRLVQKTIGFIEGVNGAYKNILVVSHRWETPTDPDPDGAQAWAVQAYLKAHPEIDAVWFDFSSMPQGAKKTLRESAEFKEMLPNINLLYLTCSVLILMDRTYMSRFWTQFEAYLSMRAITSDGLTNALDPQARVTIKTADDP